MKMFNVHAGSPMCAFCKYWYDPAGRHIAPENPRGGLWKYDERAYEICQQRGTKTRSGIGCSHYVCKVD